MVSAGPGQVLLLGSCEWDSGGSVRWAVGGVGWRQSVVIEFGCEEWVEFEVEGRIAEIAA